MIKKSIAQPWASEKMVIYVRTSDASRSAMAPHPVMCDGPKWMRRTPGSGQKGAGWALILPIVHNFSLGDLLSLALFLCPRSIRRRRAAACGD